MFLAIAFSLLAGNPTDVVCSANGRYCAEVRWHEEAAIVALYEVGAWRRRIAEIPIERERIGNVLVSDSGRYVVATRFRSGGCTAYVRPEDPMVSVYRSDGTRTAGLIVGDVFDPYDAWRLMYGDVEFELRGETVVVHVEHTERRIDLASGKLLDEQTSIFPRPRVEVMAVPGDVDRPFVEARAECAAMFDDPSLVRLESEEFLREAVERPVPDYPILAMKARISGVVRVELVVSEEGDVLCARHSALPFGAAKAMADAVMRWKFAPYGKRFAGEVLFRLKLD